MTNMTVLPQYYCGLAYFCLIGLHVMIVNFILIEAQVSTAADELLAQKEGELTKFVHAVETNANDCDKLKGCSSSSDGCSRLACYEYGNPRHSDYQCLGVANNSDCGSQCKERNFDFSKGFVRRVDTANQNIAQTVCIQRTLDDHFRKSTISNSSHLFRAYFGSVDGTTRLYPGLDEKCDFVYDPRLRPWYLESTYVPKSVTVLLDSGNDMRAKLPAGTNDETYIGKAKNMILQFLGTLAEDSDFVHIACFEYGDKIIPLNAVSTKYNARTQLQLFNDSLVGIISNESVKTNPNAVDTGNAINEAIAQLNNPFESETHLKVIIVLTSGRQFQNLSDLNINSTNSGVNVFVYNFLTANRTAQCDLAIRASSEQIPSERFYNPLYALHSYYSFLAKIHKKFKGDQTDYGQRYPDYSGVDNSTLTLSKAAFGPNGELLGVVGIDFFQKNIEEQYNNMQFESIVIAARNHDPTITYQSNLIPNVCFNHTDTCPGYTYEQGFLCEEKTGDKNIGCCGKCKHKKKELAPILGGILGGVAGLLAIAAVVHFTKPCIARKLEQKKILAENPNFIFPGPDNEPVNQSDSTGSFGRRASLGNGRYNLRERI